MTRHVVLGTLVALALTGWGCGGSDDAGAPPPGAVPAAAPSAAPAAASTESLPALLGAQAARRETRGAALAYLGREHGALSRRVGAERAAAVRPVIGALTRVRRRAAFGAIATFEP